MGFEYVIKKQKHQKICFGSGCSRSVLGDKGLTAYMMYHTTENHPDIAPWTYDSLRSFNYINKKPRLESLSKRGYNSLANRGKSLKAKDDFPAPWTYAPEISNTKVKQSKYPFNSNVSRSVQKINKNPGPGSYVPWEKKGLTFQHSFGGRTKLNLAVEIKCCSRNNDVCSVCGKQVCGDYWHKNNKEFLCDNCMTKRQAIVKKDKNQHLKQYKRIRDCSKIHFHDGTDSKTWLIDSKTLTKWMRKETYLSIYMDEINRL